MPADLNHLNARFNHFVRLFCLDELESGAEFDFRPAIAESIQELAGSAAALRDRYYERSEILSGTAFHHSDLLANLILRASGHLLQSGHANASHSLAKVNKALHGLDFFPTGVVPEVLKLVHPLGTVIGRTQLPSRAVVYQGVSVGARLPNSPEDRYPTFEGPVILFARAAVFGNSRIGSNVVFGADAMVMDAVIPSNSVVVGRYPSHRVLPGAEKIFRLFFNS